MTTRRAVPQPHHDWTLTVSFAVAAVCSALIVIGSRLLIIVGMMDDLPGRVAFETGRTAGGRQAALLGLAVGLGWISVMGLQGASRAHLFRSGALLTAGVAVVAGALGLWLGAAVLAAACVSALAAARMSDRSPCCA